MTNNAICGSLMASRAASIRLEVISSDARKQQQHVVESSTMLHSYILNYIKIDRALEYSV